MSIKEVINNKSIGSDGVRWHFDSELYEKYTDGQRIITTIEKYDKARLLEEFSELDQIKIISFLQDYQKDETQCITEEQARKIIREWSGNENSTS